MRVAIYTRVSTADQTAENQSLQIKDYCKKQGWIVYKEYSDVISGKEKSRPDFNLMFQDAHKQLFDVIVFWDLSRFSRSGTLYTLQKLKELENLGIDWVSYNEQYFRSIGPFRDAVLSIMATLAKMEREKISDRTKAGMARAKNVGKRGPDKKPRRRRSDRGIKRGGRKK